MIISDILGNVRRLVEDEASFRWTDKPIVEYVVEGVNEIFRKTGSVTDTVPFDLVQSQNEYDLNLTDGSGFSIDGRVIAIRLLPENTVETKTLQQVQVADLPTDFSTESDPTAYAISQVDQAGNLDNYQKIIFNFAPARSTSSNPYGFFVDISREWDFALAGTTATSPENSTTVPVLPKFDRHLTNLVAGYLFMESNDASYVQKGQLMQATAMQYISDIGYVNSISNYVWQPSRLFP